MELDKRIKSLKSIRSFNTDNSDCSGKFGYFTNYVSNFDNLDDVCKGTCVFEEGGSFPFYAIKTDSLENRKFQFFIPENELLPKKEKKYRPCTLGDFGLNIGDLIKFRRKDDHNSEICTIYTGYVKYKGIIKVQLGAGYYAFEELFNKYEWFDKDSNTWEPFGVEE